jgi:hypothetical protein
MREGGYLIFVFIMGNPVGPDVLPEDPETRALYRQHWQSIRTEEATGNPIQERCNFTLHEMRASTFSEMVVSDISTHLYLGSGPL